MDRNSREYMLWCEADHVCKLPSITERRQYLARIEKRRGQKAAAELKAKVAEVWERRKSLAKQAKTTEGQQ